MTAIKRRARHLLVAPLALGALLWPAATSARTAHARPRGVGTSGPEAKLAGTAAGGADVATPKLRAPKAVKGTVRQKVAPYTVSPSSTTTKATVTLSTLAKIPRSFMGLSMNVNEEQDYTDEPAAFENFIRLLTPSGDGPFVLRLGGTEIDESYWEDDENMVPTQFQVNPKYTFQLTPSWLDSLATVVQATGAKVLLNVNAGAHDPQMAVNYLQAAEQTLPSGSLIGTLIGNEPDLYHKSTNPIGHNQPWSVGFGARDYATLFGQYARTLSEAFPALPIGGPEVAAPKADWSSVLLHQDSGEAGLITTHIYPWNACYSQSAPQYPQVGYYLISSYPEQTAQSIVRTVEVAKQQRLKVRLTELGDATCGGAAGVTNTFAPALWSINQLFDFMKVGVGGVNVHIRADLPNTALQSLDGTLTASPFFYGLATVAKALDGGGRVMKVSGKLPANVTLWAVRNGDGWHLLYVNSNATKQTVVTKVPAKGTLTESLLTAPSPSSTTATLAGQTISSTGTWQGTLTQTKVALKNGTYRVTIPADSAILGTASLP